MTSWQDLRVVRDETFVDRARPLLGPLRRRPVHAVLAACLVLCGVVGVASSGASVVDRCAAAGAACPRFDPAASDRARVTTHCLAAYATGGSAQEVGTTRIETIERTPALVTTLATGGADEGEESVRSVTVTPEGAGSVTTPVAGDASTAPVITVSTGATWVLPDLGALDAWLDDHDARVLDERRIAGGGLDAAVASRLGAPAPAGAAPDITVTTHESASGNLLPDGPVREARVSAGQRAVVASYPLATVGRTQIVTTNHRPEAQGEQRVTTFYAVPPSEGAEVSGSGILTVVLRRGDDGGERLIGVEVVHVESAPTGSPDAPGKPAKRRPQGSTLVTTVRVDVSATERAALWPWLAAVEAGLDDGRIPIPPNLTDPSQPVPKDAIQDALYESATVLREEVPSTTLRGEAAVLSWTGLDGEQGGPGSGRGGDAHGSQLMDRSADGVRRVERPLTCRDSRG